MSFLRVFIVVGAIASVCHASGQRMTGTPVIPVRNVLSSSWQSLDDVKATPHVYCELYSGKIGHLAAPLAGMLLLDGLSENAELYHEARGVHASDPKDIVTSRSLLSHTRTGLTAALEVVWPIYSLWRTRCGTTEKPELGTAGVASMGALVGLQLLYLIGLKATAYPELSEQDRVLLAKYNSFAVERRSEEYGSERSDATMWRKLALICRIVQTFATALLAYEVKSSRNIIDWSDERATRHPAMMALYQIIAGTSMVLHNSSVLAARSEINSQLKKRLLKAKRSLSRGRHKRTRRRSRSV